MNASLLLFQSYSSLSSGFPRELSRCLKCCAHVKPARSFSRSSRQLREHAGPIPKRPSLPRPGKAYIALGSNVGDRIKNIEQACKELDQDGLRVTRTSALYETKPMYYEDQGSFINGVCETDIKEDIEPMELLAMVKDIENRLGRHKTIEKGPRNIDLDILLLGDTIYSHPDLYIPNALMLEREFVLRPLADLIPNLAHPSHPETPFSKHLASLRNPDPQMSSIHPLRTTTLTPTLPTRKTHLMAILNLTPDSFSDGSAHDARSPSFLSLVRAHASAGATILDVGGQSTAPRAPEVSAEEELSRVLPAISLIRSRPEFDSLLVSVDTYRADVARAAVRAGADVVNDVSGGTLDSRMLATVAELGCSYIMMHMRGSPADMATRTDYPDGLVPTVARELRERLKAAEEAGIRRWRIMLDPGIGFAKDTEQNLELLRELGRLREWEGLRGFPWLVGASRKRFVGEITGVREPRERTWGTAATVAASVLGGADVVRMHDVEEMARVAKMADAIWRVDK